MTSLGQTRDRKRSSSLWNIPVFQQHYNLSLNYIGEAFLYSSILMTNNFFLPDAILHGISGRPPFFIPSVLPITWVNPTLCKSCATKLIFGKGEILWDNKRSKVQPDPYDLELVNALPSVLETVLLSSFIMQSIPFVVIEALRLEGRGESGRIFQLDIYNQKKIMFKLFQRTKWDVFPAILCFPQTWSMLCFVINKHVCCHHLTSHFVWCKSPSSLHWA